MKSQNWLERRKKLHLPNRGMAVRGIARTFLGMVVCLFLFTSSASGGQLQSETCEFWVAPSPEGNNANPGTYDKPWADLRYASETVPDNGCTVWVKDGLYSDHPNLIRRFKTMTTFKAEHPYQAIFEYNDVVLSIDGGKNITIEGFEMRHLDAPYVDDIVLAVSGNNEITSVAKIFAEDIVIRNNIIHDAYNNDLLKLYDGVKNAVVENNIFYNSGPYESHMDVNSVSDVIIQDNIYFQDYAASGREDPGNSKQFIIIKDSGENKDGMLGSRRVTVRRNIFFSWAGTTAKFVKVGNDGKSFHEGFDIHVENNLFIGNSTNMMDSPFGVSGGRDIYFTNNTVVGDYPANTYAFTINVKGANPDNENIYFYNNIWYDPTGTMGSNGNGSGNLFAIVQPNTTHNLVLDNNLYWNGPDPIPDGDGVHPLKDDPHHIVENPQLNTSYDELIMPVWNGETFDGGSTTIRQEFVRLAMQFARIPVGSPAVDSAVSKFAPTEDILGRWRGPKPDLGAYEVAAPSNLAHCWWVGLSCYGTR